MSIVLLQVSTLAQATKKFGRLRIRIENTTVQHAWERGKVAMARMTVETKRIREGANLDLDKVRGTADALSYLTS